MSLCQGSRLSPVLVLLQLTSMAMRWSFNMVQCHPWASHNCAETNVPRRIRLAVGMLISTMFHVTQLLPLRFALFSYPVELAVRLWHLYSTPECHARGFLPEALITSLTFALGLAYCVWTEAHSRRTSLIAGAGAAGPLPAGTEAKKSK